MLKPDYHQVLEEALALTQRILPDRETLLSAKTSLYQDMGLDSLQRMELVAHFENHFNVTLKFEHLMELDTFDDIAQLIFTERSQLVRTN